MTDRVYRQPEERSSSDSSDKNPGRVHERAPKDIASQVGDWYEVSLIDRVCEQVR
jgi:hypothetical protein